MTTFYNNYIALCAKKKKSASAVATEIGLSRTSPNGWKNGKMPSDINLIKLADYFGVTVEELTTENKKSPTPEGVELSPVKQEAWKILNSMSDDKLEKVLVILRAAAEM